MADRDMTKEEARQTIIEITGEDPETSALADMDMRNLLMFGEEYEKDLREGYRIHKKSLKRSR